MKKIFALFVALLMLASLAVPVAVAEEAETYEALYDKYLAELSAIADEDIDLTTVLFSYIGEDGAELDALTAAEFGLSEEYVLEEIADITSSYRMFALHLPTDTREGVAEAMAMLDLHPKVKSVGMNVIEHLPPIEEPPIVPEEVKAALYDWMVEAWDWKHPIDEFAPQDLTGDAHVQDYRIYRLYEGMLDAIGYERVGDRVLTYSTIGQGLVAAKTENGAITEIYELKAAYDAGIIDGAALDKIPDGYGIGVSIVGDLNNNDQIEVGDILGLKAWIMESPSQSVEEMPDNLIYDIDSSRYVDVGDIVALKSIIMTA